MNRTDRWALIQRLEAQGLTQAQAAERVGLSVERLRNIWQALSDTQWGGDWRDRVDVKPHSLLAHIRRGADRSAAETARQMKVSRASVHNWEEGKCWPTMPRLIQLLGLSGWRLEVVSPSGERHPIEDLQNHKRWGEE